MSAYSWLRLVLCSMVVSLASCKHIPPPPEHYRKIDMHTHFGPAAAARALELMDRYGIDVVVNLSGGSPGQGLEEQLAQAAQFQIGRAHV